MSERKEILRNGDRAILRRGLENIPVKVMVRAEGWAMVRTPQGVPFVCREKNLIPKPAS
jgi:hypothetical protein